MNRLLLLFIFIACNARISIGQNPDWMVFNTSNSGLPDNRVLSIAIDQYNHKWIGTVYGGVAQFDNNHWTIYNQSNSGLFAHDVNAALVDPYDNKWFGSGWTGHISRFNDNDWMVFDSSNTMGIINDYFQTTDFLYNNGKLFIATFNFGLVIYDGINWTDSTVFNSSIPGMAIWDLASDPNGNIWLAQADIGLTKFDGTSWINFNTSNSMLPSNEITSVATESNGVVWATTRYNGLVKIDGNAWTVYTTSNSGLPSNSFNKIMIDNSNVKWIATGNGGTGAGSGLVKYNDLTWTVYDTSNSAIPSNDVISILIDPFDNKWIGTQNDGLAVFREGGVILSGNEILQNHSYCHISPNPFKHHAIIQFYNPDRKKYSLSILGTTGQTVQQYLPISEDNFRVEKGNLNSGLYFYRLETSDGPAMTGKLIID